MCIPDTESIADLFADIRELQLRQVELSQPVACVLCREGDQCWYHRQYVPGGEDANAN